MSHARRAAPVDSICFVTQYFITPNPEGHKIQAHQSENTPSRALFGEHPEAMKDRRCSTVINKQD